MNEEELRRQMDLLAEDARQRTEARNIHKVTHTNTVTTIYRWMGMIGSAEWHTSTMDVIGTVVVRVSGMTRPIPHVKSPWVEYDKKTPDPLDLLPKSVGRRTFGGDVGLRMEVHERPAARDP